MTGDSTESIPLLLVEDSPADVFLIRRAMQEEGLQFSLEVAEDGEAAIRFIAQIDEGLAPSVPHLMLIDVNVPRKSGSDVLQRVRSSPRVGNIPVVMISSSDSPAERRRASELGATAYFCKPSSLTEFMKLGKLVRELLAGHRTLAGSVLIEQP